MNARQVSNDALVHNQQAILRVNLKKLDGALAEWSWH